MASALPVVVNGDFGMSPFRGQLSGNPLPAGTVYLWYQDQNTIGVEK